MTQTPIIMKFGGTSVADADAFTRVAALVHKHETARPVVVVSAMSRMTDALLSSVQTAQQGDTAMASRGLDEHFERHHEVARSLLHGDDRTNIEELMASASREIAGLLRDVADVRQQENHAVLQPPSLLMLARLQDEIVAYGERLSASLLAAVLRAHKVSARYVDARRCLNTDDEHGRATPHKEETERCTRAELLPIIEAREVPVLGGFIASMKDGTTTTLGRGGSDYTAALVGAALAAREIQIWTDVHGVLTADPRLVADARTIPRLSYAEAAELAYFGAKVLHPKTILPAVVCGIPVRICNSRENCGRETVVYFDAEMTPRTVKAIAHKTGVTIVHVTSARMLGAYGFLHAIFEVFDRYRTAVDLVATSEVSVSLSLDETSALDAIVAELQKVGAVKVETKRALISVVGEGLRSTPGIAGLVFHAIRDINILLISQGASNINLTFVIEEERVREAVSRLHAEFFERAEPESRPHDKAII